MPVKIVDNKNGFHVLGTILYSLYYFLSSLYISEKSNTIVQILIVRLINNPR